MILDILLRNTFSSEPSETNDKAISGNRMTSIILVLASQLLLMALAIAWCVHMVLIAKHGRIFFAEPNLLILYGEIAATVLIAIFAIAVFVLQWKGFWGNTGH